METLKRQKRSRLGGLKKNSSLIEKLYLEGVGICRWIECDIRIGNEVAR